LWGLKRPGKRVTAKLANYRETYFRLVGCSIGLTSIAGSFSSQSLRSLASNSVRRPRFTARNAPDLMAA
jgi:hypothetical protein